MTEQQYRRWWWPFHRLTIQIWFTTLAWVASPIKSNMSASWALLQVSALQDTD